MSWRSRQVGVAADDAPERQRVQAHRAVGDISPECVTQRGEASNWQISAVKRVTGRSESGAKRGARPTATNDLPQPILMTPKMALGNQVAAPPAGKQARGRIPLRYSGPHEATAERDRVPHSSRGAL